MYMYGVATISRLLKIIGLFCKVTYKRDDTLQKRLIIWRSLSIVATPYLYLRHFQCLSWVMGHDSFIVCVEFATWLVLCVTWLVHCVTWLVHSVTWLLQLWHDSFIVCHDSFCCDMTRSLCDMTRSLCDMTRLLCGVTRPLCDMTRSLCDMTRSLCVVAHVT